MRYEVKMIFGEDKYTYGVYDNRNKANEVAMMVRDERGVDVEVVEINQRERGPDPDPHKRKEGRKICG